MISILKDTREQKGFNFEFYDIQLKRQTLKYGDYALEGNNDIIVERKSDTGELYLNLGVKKERIRFFKELEALRAFKRPILLCEFPESDLYEFPQKSYIPPELWYKLKMTPQYFRKEVYKLTTDFLPLEVVFTNGRAEAEDYVINLFKEANGGTKKFDF